MSLGYKVGVYVSKLLSDFTDVQARGQGLQVAEEVGGGGHPVVRVSAGEGPGGQG